MILNWPSKFVQWRLPVPVRRVCLTSTNSSVNTEQLREQLDQLHKEAETTRAKANSARLRLMRLSEAAEKLHRQAALSVQTGKENAGRELLLQKKKVMQALEKSKNRIELLDELSTKLSEVISVKETQLIGTVASDFEVGMDAAPTPVRIVSPKEEDLKNCVKNDDLHSSSPQIGQNEELQVAPQSLAELHNDDELNSDEGLGVENCGNEVHVVHSLKKTASYEDFLENIDRQLSKLESELATFINFSALILESKEKLENSKVQHAMEILNEVCHIRESQA